MVAMTTVELTSGASKVKCIYIYLTPKDFSLHILHPESLPSLELKGIISSKYLNNDEDYVHV